MKTAYHRQEYPWSQEIWGRGWREFTFLSDQHHGRLWVRFQFMVWTAHSLLTLCTISSLHSAISVELYYIFATVWGREQYTLYGILFFVFAILLSVGACISIALTYFQLSGEDYRWWWRSVLSVGSTGLFIFLYSVFYYARRSNMSGAVQTVEFFGYSLLTGYVFFLMLGTISFFSSLKFIRYIYVNLKMDWVLRGRSIALLSLSSSPTDLSWQLLFWLGDWIVW